MSRIRTFRTLADATDPDDIKAANALQDEIKAAQDSPGTFEVPSWDKTSHDKIRSAVKVLANTMANTNGCFQPQHKVDPVKFLVGVASAGEAIRSKTQCTSA